jgi:hypothetical protein
MSRRSQPRLFLVDPALPPQERPNDPDRLEDLLAERFNAAWRQSVLGIIEAGRILREAREKLPRGRFVPWVKERLGRTRRTADVLIAIAEDPRIENHSSQMPASWRTLYDISRLGDEEFYRLLADGTINPDMQRSGSQQLGGSGNDEIFTPPLYLDAVRDVFGDPPDLDPATCPEAQKFVQAKQCFTKEQDGLKQEWWGNVFLNGPYSKLLPFMEKLVCEYKAGRTRQAISLTMSNTCTHWFQLAAGAASAISYPDHSIAYIDKAKGQMKSGLPGGQCFMYFGPNIEKFVCRFSEFGLVRAHKPPLVMPYKPLVMPVLDPQQMMAQIIVLREHRLLARKFKAAE